MTKLGLRTFFRFEFLICKNKFLFGFRTLIFQVQLLSPKHYLKFFSSNQVKFYFEVLFIKVFVNKYTCIVQFKVHVNCLYISLETERSSIYSKCVFWRDSVDSSRCWTNSKFSLSLSVISFVQFDKVFISASTTSHAPLLL